MQHRKQKLQKAPFFMAEEREDCNCPDTDTDKETALRALFPEDDGSLEAEGQRQHHNDWKALGQIPMPRVRAVKD